MYSSVDVGTWNCFADNEQATSETPVRADDASTLDGDMSQAPEEMSEAGGTEKGGEKQQTEPQQLSVPDIPEEVRTTKTPPARTCCVHLFGHRKQTHGRPVHTSTVLSVYQYTM